MSNEKKKRGRPQKYMFWSDFEGWLLKEWYPFKINDFAHLKVAISDMQVDLSWIKWLLRGLILAIVGGSIVVLVMG